MTPIVFDSLDLNDASYITSELNDQGIADIILSVSELANQQGVSITNVGYGGKSIDASGKIIGSSVADLKTKITALKSKAYSISNTLTIDSDTQYTAAVEQININWPIRAASWCEWSASWLVPSGQGESTALNTTTFEGETTNDTVYEPTTVVGNGTCKPTVTVTINSLTSSGLQFLRLKNDVNGVYATIWYEFAALDVIVANSSTSVVTINDVEVEYSGLLPQFDLSGGSVEIERSDSFTARDVDITIEYRPTYI